MQINPFASTGLQGSVRGNMTADAAVTAADSARFSSMLDDLKTKAGAAEKKDAAPADAAAKRDADLKKACRGFEGMFLGIMYKAMRQTVPEDKLFGETNGQKIFQDMRDEELMKRVAESGGIGLADMMYRQLSPQVVGKAAKSAYEAAREAHALPKISIR